MNQDEMPLVTAVVPVYNHERYVLESIRSILRQSYPRIELIVINDGSRDHSHEMVLTLVEECKRRFVRFEYINRENIGLCATLNQSLGMAEGKYFSALASDDVLLPDKFSCLVEALELSDESAAAAFGDASFIDEDGQKVYLDEKGKIQKVASDKTYGTCLDFHTRERNFDYRTEFGSYRSLVEANYIPAMANMSKTACIKEVGGWTEGNVLEDWEMWLKLSKQHRLLFVDKVVALYRLHGQNSYDTMIQRMVRDSLILIAKEKEYCIHNGLMPEWYDSFNGLLYWVLRYGDSPLRDKLHELKSAEWIPLFTFLVSTFHKRLRKKLFKRA
jgi:alpha-1,3-rhamnosyltransferase